jgi:glycosyltransferase domain-containing protein
MITILIFSYNRHHYLRRAIKYWSLSPWPVIISDGSDEPLSCDMPAQVTYLYRHGISQQNRLMELAQLASTPYAVLAPDDDFHAFEGIRNSLEFLEKNPDYSMVQGLYGNFRIEKTQNHKSILLNPAYQYASKYAFDDANPEKRIIGAMTGPVMHYIYAVTRTETLRNTLGVLNGVEDIAVSAFEISFILSSLAQGKYRTLPIFYAAREFHSSNWSNHITFESWSRSSSSEGYEKWRLNIATLYAETTGHSVAESLRVFDKAIAKLLDYKKSNREVAQPSKKHIHKIFDIFPLRMKVMIQQIRGNGRMLKMILSHRVDLLEFRRDWKRIKQTISEFEFAVGR